MIPTPKELRQMKEEIERAYSKMLDYSPPTAHFLWYAAQSIELTAHTIDIANEKEEVNSILEWMDEMEAQGKDWRTQQREERP